MSTNRKTYPYEPETFPDTLPDYTNDEHLGEIVIERKIIVGTVPLTRYGTLNPVKAAFDIAVQYVGEETNKDSVVSVDFNFEDITYTVSSTPNAPKANS